MPDISRAFAESGAESDDDLLAFVTAQRWFGAKSRVPTHARLVDLVPLPGDDAALGIGLVEIRYQSGTQDIYQLFLGVRPAGGDPASRVTRAGPKEIYEAFDQPGGCGPQILSLMQQRAVLDASGASRLAFFRTEADIPLPTSPPRPIGADQSNSAVVFDDEVILKVYRRPEPGVSPELEMLRFLSDREFGNVPELLGWYERGGEPMEATLGVLLRYVPNTRDGFTVTLDALGTDPESVFPLLHRLGEITGAMHSVLASDISDPSFAPETPSAESIELIRASVDEEVVDLFSTLQDHEEVGPLAGRLEEIRGLLKVIEPTGDLGRRIRQHGDLHLGQGLWNGEDWVLIDFEGEPTRPVAHRRRKGLPLRDVAGVLRSISYAAWVARLDRGHTVPDSWEVDARAAFLAGYHEVVEPLGLLPPLRETTRDLLAFFELEKAVYELRYELGHRPEWARIPAAGIAALLGDTTP
jgi:maltokinase